jgi:hypothetical protein
LHFGSAYAAFLQRAPGRADGQVGSGHIGVRNVAFPNTDPFEDPLVGSLDHLFQILVGKDTGRDVATQRRDFSFGQYFGSSNRKK